MKRYLITTAIVFVSVLGVINAQAVSAQGGCIDNYEPNNDWGTATQLSPGQYHSFICASGDYDIFKINISAGENVVSLSNLQADFDIYVYSATQGRWIGQSENGGRDSEKFRWTATRNETIYVVVAPYNDAKSTTPYVLTVGRFPDFWMPVNGVGEGITTPIGSIAHRGPDEFAIDYAWEQEGVDVYPVLPGRVVYVGYDNDYGYTVVIRHWDDKKWDKKFYSIYAHLQSEGLPSLWELVGQGPIPHPIGRMGKTGKGSNGIVHLHFAVRYSDNAYDRSTALYGRKDSTIVTPAFDVRGLFR